MTRPAASPWDGAMMAAAVFAVDPVGCAGIALRASAGPVRDAFLAAVRNLLPAETALRRIPLGIEDSRLLGGIDLVATLSAGRLVAERGVLAASDDAVVLLAMAERLSAATAARLAATIDAGEIVLERDGLTLRTPARIGFIALDEGVGDDESLPGALFDRLGLPIDLSDIEWRGIRDLAHRRQDILAARGRLLCVEIGSEAIEALCATAAALGVDATRASLLAVRVARAAAALNGRAEVIAEDAALAGQLVLAPRAQNMSASPPDDEVAESSKQQSERENDAQAEIDESAAAEPLRDVVLAATEAAIPARVLARLERGAGGARSPGAGKAGAQKAAGARGRPAGVRAGGPKSGARLNVVETLRAAAPWQKLRARTGAATRSGIVIAREDFRVVRRIPRAETVTIFAVDASGSSAFNRLAEAKGAVDLLLAECYVRRDRVALLAFRGRTAEVLLAPTRSLVHAKRSLAALAGGGGTPLATGIEAAVVLAQDGRRKGQTPFIVIMTDGAANISRDGKAAGRGQARADAICAARLGRSAGVAAVVIDIAPRPQPAAQELAVEMNARYVPMPFADAAALARIARPSAVSG